MRAREGLRTVLFGTYSKKIGMWLFLLSDSLTFGALLYAYTYGRISTPNWPTPFHSESIRNATLMTAFLLTSSLTMVFAVRAAALREPRRNVSGCSPRWLADLDSLFFTGASGPT